MRIPLIRTDKKNRQYLSTSVLERLMERIAATTTNSAIPRLRRELPLLQAYGGEFAEIHTIPRVYPAVELRKDENDEPQFVRPTGLLLLSLRGMADGQETERAKQAAAALPMTVAAFMGSSGQSVKVLVRIARADGTLPDDEDGWQRLYEQAYDYAARLYDAVMPRPVSREAPTIRASFRMTLDAKPYFNPRAVTLTVTESALAGSQPMKPVETYTHRPTSLVKQHRQTDYEQYDDNEYLFRRACEQARQDMKCPDDVEDPQLEDVFRSDVARRLCRMGMGEEEAVAHMRSHLWTRADEQHVRSLVAAAYAEATTMKPLVDPAVRVRKETMDMVRFLQKRYVFRYNSVMGYTEYRPNNTYVEPYRPVDSRVQRRMALEARMEGLDVWDNDVVRFLGSDLIDDYNPVWDYLYTHCHDRWDGRDHIRQLARTVPTENPLWPQWFYTWFLGMVRQWQASQFDVYGNQVAPLLISAQGWNKSTFCRQLLPPELAWGYTDIMQLSEKKQVLQQMSQMLLVNLDEFNQVSPTLQQGFLKNIISLPSVKVKPPYGRHVEVFPRRASFIATTNMTDVLTDPTGSRRFLAVELTGPIDVSRRPNHVQLYAQALAALAAQEPSWFDEEQTRQIIESNQKYQFRLPAEAYFRDMFEPASKDDPEATYLTTTTIYEAIRQKAGSKTSIGTVNSLGRTLQNMSGLARKRTNSGTAFLVKRRK